MAELGQNLCTPARIYGPATQTLFCGCSVKSFTVSAGWNEQSSSLSVELVEDTCAGTKVWWDENLDRNTGSIVDPGFIPPEPGCPIYFRIEEDPDGASEADRGGFEYAGIVEGWTQRDGADGYPVYTVKATDPRIILENSQVILNDYPGDVENVWNLIGLYGFIESLGSVCTSSPAGGLGGVTSFNAVGNIANERGMVWNDVRCGLHTLCSPVNKTLANNQYRDYCVDNRLVYVGPTDGNDGYGIIAKDDWIRDADLQNKKDSAHNPLNMNLSYYMLDLTEIPFAPVHYRLSGPNISLMEIISQVCEDAGCDYYVELLPFKNNGVQKVIKVRVADRAVQPETGILDDYIAAKQADAAAANGGIIATTRGEEIRNEEISTYLMGGEVRGTHEATNSTMLPFWGLDSDGALINANNAGSEYLVKMDFGKLNTTLYNTFTSRYVWVSEGELRAALSDIDSWQVVSIVKDGDVGTYLTANKLGLNVRLDLLEAALNGDVPVHAAAKGLRDADFADPDIGSDASKDLDKVYDFIRSYADEFYGKQFLVITSDVCYARDTASNKLRYSHDPSTEGAWVLDGTASVIDLAHNSAKSDLFRDNVGKYQAMIKFPTTGGTDFLGAGSHIVDPRRLGDDSYLVDSGAIWVKAEVNEQWVIGTPLAPSATSISFLLTIDGPVTNNTSVLGDVAEAYGGLAEAFNELGVAGDVFDDVEVSDRGSLTMGALPIAISPTKSMSPFVSHVDVYGPWGITSLPGQVRLETDEGFVPWEYGSDVIMALAARNKVENSVTDTRKGERGSVTVAGIPNIPLCAELFSVDTASPPTSQGNQKYLGTRTAGITQCTSVLPYYFVGMNAWTGEFGPNITNVNVTWGPSGFVTEYQFSTYTPRKGRFSKDNSERLKRVGQTRLANMRNLRAKNALNRQIASAFSRSRNMLESQIGRGSRTPRSAHHFFIGKYTSSDRPAIETQPSKDASYAFSSDAVYESNAIMSLDGLLRPVSKQGRSGFSPYVNFSTQDCAKAKDTTDQADPPINEYTRLDWSQDYLDPLSNPNSTLLTNRSDTATSGHDIEVLGRGTSAPTSGWAIPEGEAGGAGGYASDYSFMAIRGPLMIQQWGRDMCGKPIPNKADSEAAAAGGTFTSLALQDKFLDGWLQKPKTWPVAPLDLVLDRERGVWVTPQPPRPVHATITGCLDTVGKYDLENGKTVYDATGGTVSTKTIDVEWPWDIDAPSGLGKIPVYYDNVDCKYYAFPVNRLDACIDGSGDIQDIKKICFSTGNSCCGGAGFTMIEETDGCGNKIATVGLNIANTVYVEGIAGCDISAYAEDCVEKISFGSGLAVYDVAGATCGQVQIDSCIYTSGYEDTCNTTSIERECNQGFVFASGLTSNYDGCYMHVTHPMTFFTDGTLCGQHFNWDADCNAVIEPATESCSRCSPGSPVTTAGPYCHRIPPKYLNRIIAGRGIGMSSCDECSLILFNNTIVTGVDDGGSCSAYGVSQTSIHQFSNDFTISAGIHAGAKCEETFDCGDATLSALISLNKGGTEKTINFVTKVCLNEEGGVDSVECGSITVRGNCNDSIYWITGSTAFDEPTPCECDSGPPTPPPP